VACDEDPLQRRRRHTVQDPPDCTPAARVPAFCLAARFGDIEEVDAERLGDPLRVPVAEGGGDADDASGAVEPPELGGPPSVRRLLKAVLVIPRRLPGPGTPVRRVGSGPEHRVVTGAVVERLAGGPDGRDRCGPVGHVTARVERERDLVDHAPHDGQREARSRLPFPPVIPDDPAADPGFCRDAAVRHQRNERAVLRPVRGGDERPCCRGTGLDVRLQRR
jgi:hypothetical protein